jgi:hypothetical protein
MVKEDIKAFVSKIASDLSPQDDRLQRQRECMPCLKNALPMDTSGGRELLHTQELMTIGQDAMNFFDTMKVHTSEQDRPIFVAAATSGVGKTRLAYSTGKFLTMVLIRVAGTPELGQPLTAPWMFLLDKLNPLHVRRDAADGNQELSEEALLYVKLLICCYVDATVSALEHGKSISMDRSTLRELALRFNRNGTGEGIVTKLFESKCIELLDNDNTLISKKVAISTYRGNIDTRFADAFDSTKELLLICFDEVQELLTRLPRLFIRETKFLSTGIIDDRAPRDLFYGVACAMRSHTNRCPNWIMFMAGTHLSISKISVEDGVSGSLLRNRIEEVIIMSNLLKSCDMKKMIQHYWDIADSVFTEEVIEALDCYRGRPYFFMEGVFPHIVEATRNEDNLTSEKLIRVLKSRLGPVTRNTHRRIQSMFDSNRAIVGSGDRTVHALIPSLIKAIVCGDGKLLLRGDEDISNAILDGVILASSDEAYLESTEKNIKDSEPLMHSCLADFISRYPVDLLMSLVLNQIREDSGATAEEMFCYWLALTVYATNKRDNSNGILLGNLLQPLYDGDIAAHFPANLLNEYMCSATRVVNLHGASFESEIGTLSSSGKLQGIITNSIFYNIHPLCGLDIVFIVKHRYEDRYKLVAIQSKNYKSIAAKDIMMTLSPGLQFLENKYRRFVITGNAPVKNTLTRAGHRRWENWCEFCEVNDSSVGSNWIRVVLVSRRVSSAIHAYVGTEQFLCGLDDKTKKLYWTLFASKDKKQRRQQTLDKAALASGSSPLVFLSMSSDKWLTEELRGRFVNQSQVEVRGIQFSKNRKECPYWVPVSVQMSRDRLSELPL